MYSNEAEISIKDDYDDFKLENTFVLLVDINIFLLFNPLTAGYIWVLIFY